MNKPKLTGMAALFVMLTAVIWSSAVRQSILTAGERCLTILIPSLYFYSLLSAFCIRSGGLRSVCGSKGLLWGILLFSQIGGYPVGAQLLHELTLTGELDAKQEKHLLCVCFGCGPGFLLGTVCRGLPTAVTFWVMLSVTLPNLLLGLFVLHGFQAQERPVPAMPLVQQFTGAAESAADAMLKVTAMILAFAALTGIPEGMGIFSRMPEETAQTVRSLLEVSNVTALLQAGGTLPAAAACLSFGGICVHLQLAAITGGIDWGTFLLTRTAAAAMTGGICFAGMKWLFCGSVPAFLPAAHVELTADSILPGTCLLVMAIMLLNRPALAVSHADAP